MIYRLSLLVLCFALAAGAGLARDGKDAPLQVFILCGQSNMQGHAAVRTFDHIGMDPKTAPLLDQMRDENGEPRVCERVWISSIGSSEEEKTGKLTAGFGAGGREPKIGPEFTFGLTMEKLVDGPILIIKTAWGGKSLHTDFRPPSAGPYEFNESQLENLEKQGKDIAEAKKQRAEASAHYYRLMADHVKKVLADIPRVVPEYDAERGHELAGFVWFQGWNDMVDRGVYPTRDQPGGYDDYSELMAAFIRDVRQDFDAPDLPFVIGVMGAGGPTAAYLPDQKRYQGVHQNFRDAMAAPASLPEFEGNVSAVLTEKFWDQQLTRLRSKNNQVNRKQQELKKEGKLGPAELREAVESYRNEVFTPGELEILEKGVSNAEYHYLGSAKIMAGIGKGFAEAMAKLKGE